MNPIVIEPELYTQQDLEEWSTQGQRFELIRGELKVMAPVGGVHGSLTADLSGLVGLHANKNKLGECFTAGTGFIAEENPPTILAPDFTFIRQSRVTYPIPQGYMPLAPDLVLETRSPGDTARAVAAKVELWLEVGAREVWELNPRSKVLTVYRPDAEPLALTADDKLESELLPGLSLELRIALS